MTDVVATNVPVILAEACRLPADSNGNAFRILAVRIESGLAAVETDVPPAPARARSLLVTSIDESTPILACRLAVALADSGRRTCLVEATFRYRSEEVLTGAATDENGLLDWLADKNNAVVELLETDVPYLKLLPRGRNERVPVDMLRADLVRRLTAELSRDCEWIVWAGPPVATAAGMAVAGVVDGVVLVIPPGKVTRGDAQRACAAIDAVRGCLLGTVLIDV